MLLLEMTTTEVLTSASNLLGELQYCGADKNLYKGRIERTIK